MGKRKSPLGALQLIRRHAHVEYDTVDAFMTVGAGEGHPIASNATPEGRQANRRVELTLEPITQG